MNIILAPVLCLLQLVVYGFALWQIGNFPRMKRVPIGLGGWFTPHAFRITRSKRFVAVCSTWCVFLIALSVSPIFLETSAKGYFLSIILPIVASVILVYLLVSTCVLFRSCAERAVAQALDTAPLPFVVYPESEYPSCLAGVKEESEMMPLLRHPELSSATLPTSFQGAVREIPSELVALAKECVPQLWIQPLHPELGKAILVQMQHLNETAHIQAEKSLDAQKKAAEAKAQVTAMEASLAELQKSNETLNNKLLSLRTRTRGASGGDFNKMTRQELDVERDRLMDTLRKLDDERRRKGTTARG
ncbi:MAG: hypothetical protein V1746_00490 [bacterium]